MFSTSGKKTGRLLPSKHFSPHLYTHWEGTWPELGQSRFILPRLPQNGVLIPAAVNFEDFLKLILSQQTQVCGTFHPFFKPHSPALISFPDPHNISLTNAPFIRSLPEFVFVAFWEKTLTDTLLLRSLSQIYMTSSGRGTKEGHDYLVNLGLFLKISCSQFKFHNIPWVDDITRSSGGNG